MWQENLKLVLHVQERRQHHHSLRSWSLCPRWGAETQAWSEHCNSQHLCRMDCFVTPAIEPLPLCCDLGELTGTPLVQLSVTSAEQPLCFCPGGNYHSCCLLGKNYIFALPLSLQRKPPAESFLNHERQAAPLLPRLTLCYPLYPLATAVTSHSRHICCRSWLWPLFTFFQRDIFIQIIKT